MRAPRESGLGLVLPFLLVGTLVLPGVAAASRRSEELVREGVAAVAVERYAHALQLFEEATLADPADADAVFYQGVALNRLGGYGAALERLQRAAAMGTIQPDLAFETGVSLVGQRRWRDGVEQLEESERARPGRAETSLLLGRAYLALGEPGRAEEHLRETIRRDPALTPAARLHLAVLARRRGNLRAAQAEVETLLRETPDAPLGRAPRGEVERLPRLALLSPPAEKPWHLSASVTGGYNSNVIALGETTPLPSDISRKSSLYNRFTVAGSYEWRPTTADTLTAGYAFLADVYYALSDADVLDHYWYLDYRHLFAGSFIAGFRVSDEFTQIGGDAFRNQVGLRPATGYRFTDWAAVELAYNAAVSDYYFAASPVQDRDAVAHAVGLTGFVTIPGTGVQLRLGYFHVWNRADGNDFDFESNGLLLGVTAPLLWRVTGDVAYTHTFDRYDHPNSLAGPNGFAFRRSDDADSLTVRLVRPVLAGLRVFLRYDFTHADSNIPFFTYTQHIWSAGVIAEF